MKSAVIALFLFVPALLAQEFRASITGEVNDSSGAAVPQVRVIATNIATNVASEALTNEAGLYVISFLPPSRYTVTVEHTGFKKFIREDPRM